MGLQTVVQSLQKLEREKTALTDLCWEMDQKFLYLVVNAIPLQFPRMHVS